MAFGILMNLIAMTKKKSLDAFVDRFRRQPYCGRHTYYDSLLNKVDIFGGIHSLYHYSFNLYPVNLVDVHKTWEVFRQTFIDECFNKGMCL